MSELTMVHEKVLKYLHKGGLLAVAIYGKSIQTTEVVTYPKFNGVGLKSINYIMDLGFIRYGDPSPYKSGRVVPIVLTYAGKVALGLVPDTECDACQIGSEGHEYDCPEAQV